MLHIGLFTKSEDWKYEQEFRIISNPGNHSFSASALQEVIIGAKTSKANEEKVKDLLSVREYAHVKLKRAFNVPGTFAFGSRSVI